MNLTEDLYVRNTTICHVPRGRVCEIRGRQGGRREGICSLVLTFVSLLFLACLPLISERVRDIRPLRHRPQLQVKRRQPTTATMTLLSRAFTDPTNSDHSVYIGITAILLACFTTLTLALRIWIRWGKYSWDDAAVFMAQTLAYAQFGTVIASLVIGMGKRWSAIGDEDQRQIAVVRYIPPGPPGTLEKGGVTDILG